MVSPFFLRLCFLGLRLNNMDIESIVFMIGCATATYRNGIVILLLVMLSDFNSAHDSFLYGEQCYWEWGILFSFSFSTRP